MTHVIEVGNGVLMTPCPKDGDVILTRRLLEVRGPVCGRLPASASRKNTCTFGQVVEVGDGRWKLPRLKARIYGSAQPERIKFEWYLGPYPLLTSPKSYKNILGINF